MADGLQSALGQIGSNSILDASLSTADIADAAISGALIADQGIGAGKIKNAALTATQLANNSASGAIVATAFPTVKTGSPSVGGNSIQFGEDSAIGSPGGWVVFGTGFAAAPKVLLTSVGSTAQIAPYLVTIAAGSFQYVGENTIVHHYTAIGSGRI